MSRTAFGLVPVLTVLLSCGEELPLELEAGSGTSEDAILNGNTSFSGKAFMENRTAKVVIGDSLCSGTFLDPVTALTARHCVTSDGKVDGSLMSASKVNVRTANGQRTDVQKIVHYDKDHDVALLFLKSEIYETDGDPLFTPLATTPAEDYLEDAVYISGWGENSKGSGSNVLRWGEMIVHDDYVGSCGAAHDLLKLRMTSADERGWAGDSGGPVWGNQTRPQGVLGVLNGTSCGLDPRTLATRTSNNIYLWARDQIKEHHGMPVSGTALQFNSNADLDDSVRKYSPDGDPAQWRIEDGDLVQTKNVPNSPIIWKRFGGRDFWLLTQITYVDDDSAGIAFHFVDEENYYTCDLNDSQNTLRLTRRYRGDVTTLASTSVTTSLVGKTISMVALGESNTYSCYVWLNTSGSGSPIKVSKIDYRLPVGWFGLWQHQNENVRFSKLEYSGDIYSPSY